MAARRSFQPAGDNTPAMRPVERLPLRERQNERFGQQQLSSANKPISCKSPFKKKPGVKVDPCDVISLMIKHGQMAVEPPFCPPLCHASPGLAPLGAVKLAKENTAAVLAEEEESVFGKCPPDSLTSEVMEKDLEQWFGNCSKTVMTQSEPVRDIAGTVQIRCEGEGTDSVRAHEQSISIVDLPLRQPNSVAQTATDTPAVHHVDRDADVTFKSFSCSGLDLEIASVSLQPEESILLLPEGPHVVSGCCSFQEECSDGLGFPQHADQSSRADHEDHPYCLLEHEDSSSGGDVIPGGASDMDSIQQEDPPDLVDHSGQALLWTSGCSVGLVAGRLLHSPPENVVLSSVARQQDRAAQGFAPDQSHNKTETSITADQSIGCVHPDQSQGTEATDVTADLSDGFAAQCLIGDQQSHDTAGIGLLADQSMASAEMSVADDQSLGNLQKSVAADQSQDIKMKNHSSADQSRVTMVRSLGDEQSQTVEVCGVPADKSKPCTLLLMGISEFITGHAQETPSEDPSSDVTTGHAQETPSEDPSSDVTTGHAQETPSEDPSSDVTTGHAQEEPSEDTSSDVTTGHAQEKPPESTSCDVTTGHAQEKPSEDTSSDVTTGHARETPPEDTSCDVTTGHAQGKPSEDISFVTSRHAQETPSEDTSSVTTGHAQEKPSESTLHDVTTGHAQETPSEGASSDVTTGHAQETPPEDASSDVTTGHAQEKSFESNPSEGTSYDVTTGHAQETPSEGASSDVTTGHAQETPSEGASSDVTTGHAQQTPPEDASSDVTTGHAQEKPFKSNPSEGTSYDIITGHAQKRRSDVISGNAQKRRFEAASCVDARTPALGRTTHLIEPGPAYPWDAGDSPLGPRKSRLLMGKLESPMPLPQLNSTLIICVPNSAAATPQITKPETEALPAPAEGRAGPRVAPLQENLGPQTPGDLPGAQSGALKVNLGPQANEGSTDNELGALKVNLGPQANGDSTDSQSGPVQEKSRGLQVPGDVTVSQLGPPEKLRPLQTPVGRADARSGPLKVNLRQMGELLLRASQNLVSPVECHSAATLTSPVQRVEHGVNTSGFFERKREPSVAEACTNTDTLLWNVAPELMAGWSRQDLEQRLFSSLVMVEALSQQLASARTHRPPCAPPSETRERAAQTHHTELGQGALYRELFVRAQGRLQELDLQQEELKRLVQQLGNGCTSVAALAAETERALSSVNEMGQMASDDQHRLSQQMSQVRALYGRFREVLKRSNERVQRCHQEKLLMEQQRDEALGTRDAALAVLEQLQSRHAAQVCELEKSLGSHLELIPALSHACREQGLLKEEYTQSLQAADDLLQDTLRDHARLSDELRKAHSLLRRTGPVLQKLHEKAAVAWQVQNQLEQDSERVRDELDQTSSHLHEAQNQIGDLNLQITILTSEMGVLRQRLSEEEEDRSHAEMKNTELSAALSSTQASYSLLQQALSTQTHRSEEVEESLSRRVEELGRALADRDSQLALSERLLQELQSQLSNVCEINEFLQVESQVSREQMAHSEGLVKSHLQSLRERNLECEDLKRELCALQQQRNSLQEEVRSIQETAQRHLQEMEKQLLMASSEITLLHHKVYKLTSALNTTHSSQKPDRPTSTVPPINSAPPRHTARSFVDSVMVAVSAEEPQASEKDEGLVTALGSGNSAFTRVPAAAPKMQDAVEESGVLEQLKGLGQAVSQLVCKVVCVREQSDRQYEDLRLTVSSQQEALDSQATRHRLEVVELKEQVSRLQAQVEESSAAQRQKAQEERTFRKLCRDLDESKELVQQQKSENKELRRDVSELRGSLLQAQSELQLLREEFSDGQASERLHPLQERLRLQQEVDKLRSRLQESEESRGKLLERAKRHKVVLEGNQRQLEKELYLLDQTIRTVKQTLLSIPDVVKSCKQLEDLVTYLE